MERNVYRLKVIPFDLAKRLKAIGFNQKTVILYYINNEAVAAPHVDEVIAWLRDNFNIHVYNRVPPFVNPLTGDIEYLYGVKRCYPLFGWNQRETIYNQYKGFSDPFLAKIDAIDNALTYLEQK